MSNHIHAGFSAIKRAYLSPSLVSTITKTIIASILIALSAHASIRVGVVPFTLQTMAISIIAYTLGSRLALCATLLYIAQGLVGLPVFASGIGLSAILGPSGGFIVGFLAFAYIMGRAGDLSITNIYTLSFYAIFASAVLFAFGLAQLSFFVPASKLLAVGLYPFVLPGIIKAIVSAMLLSPAARYFGRL